tara:strand:- start:376 stop:552 length:177 start_codon:yes stop_codon:yes gene_type:complete
MREVYESIKAAVQGPAGTALEAGGGILLSLWGALPDILRVCILIATFIHIVVRIRKDS